MVAISDISEGIAEESDYALKYEKAFEETNTYAGQIYDTDLVRDSLHLYPWYIAATYDTAYGIKATNVGSGAYTFAYLDESLDETRPVYIIVSTRNGDNGALTFDGVLYVLQKTNDGGAGTSTLISEGSDFIFTANGGYKTTIHTAAANLFTAGTQLHIYWESAEVAKDVYITSIQLRYYLKRG